MVTAIPRYFAITGEVVGLQPGQAPPFGVVDGAAGEVAQQGIAGQHAGRERCPCPSRRCCPTGAGSGGRPCAACSRRWSAGRPPSSTSWTGTRPCPGRRNASVRRPRPGPGRPRSTRRRAGRRVGCAAAAQAKSRRQGHQADRGEPDRAGPSVLRWDDLGRNRGKNLNRSKFRLDLSIGFMIRSSPLGCPRWGAAASPPGFTAGPWATIRLGNVQRMAPSGE